MSDWPDLAEELDAWREAGQCAELWLRDDDAGAPEPSLHQLVAMCREYDVPASFAAIPAHSTEKTRELIAELEQARVLVHGYAHTDHSTDDERKTEYSMARSVAEVEDEWRDAIRMTREAYGALALPVFVPPWNRMAPALEERLSAVGFTGFSGLGPRAAATSHDLTVVNVHVDLFDSRRGTFRGRDASLRAIVNHLQAKRLAEADSGEPTGVMTHHLVFDADCWFFLRRLFDSTAGRNDVRWCAAPQIFGISA